jgi:hypothetical protein
MAGYTTLRLREEEEGPVAGPVEATLLYRSECGNIDISKQGRISFRQETSCFATVGLVLCCREQLD